MTWRLASLLVLTAALAACREPMSDRGERGPIERAFSAVSGRGGDSYYNESVSPYERGVRDGLRDAEFDREERSAAYRRGYDAGRRELQRDRQSYQGNGYGTNDSYYGERAPPRSTRAARAARAADYAADSYNSGDYYRSDYATGYESDYRNDYRSVGAGFSGGSRQVPSNSMRACTNRVERMYGLRAGSASAVSSRPRDNGGYDVDVRADGRYAICRVNADGVVKSVDER